MNLVIIPTYCVAILRSYALRSSARNCARDFALPLPCTGRNQRLRIYYSSTIFLENGYSQSKKQLAQSEIC